MWSTVTGPTFVVIASGKQSRASWALRSRLPHRALPATTAKAANHPIALAAWIDALAIPVAQLYGQPTARKPLNEPVRSDQGSPSELLPSQQAGGHRGRSAGIRSQVIWRLMQQRARPRHQMIILGSVKPTQEEWIAAGVEQRLGELQTIRLAALNGFIVLYSGFTFRPWGSIHLATADALAIGFPSSLNNWRQSYHRRATGAVAYSRCIRNLLACSLDRRCLGVSH